MDGRGRRSGCAGGYPWYRDRHGDQPELDCACRLTAEPISPAGSLRRPTAVHSWTPSGPTTTRSPTRRPGGTVSAAPKWLWRSWMTARPTWTIRSARCMPTSVTPKRRRSSESLKARYFIIDDAAARTYRNYNLSPETERMYRVAAVNGCWPRCMVQRGHGDNASC